MILNQVFPDYILSDKRPLHVESTYRFRRRIDLGLSLSAHKQYSRVETEIAPLELHSYHYARD